VKSVARGTLTRIAASRNCRHFAQPGAPEPPVREQL
jgi:hypothetical protein